MNSRECKLIDVVNLKSGTTVRKGLERGSGDVAYIKVSGMSLGGNEVKITTSNTYLNHEDINSKNILPIGSTIFPKRGGAIATNKKRLTEIALCVDLNIMGAIPKTELVLPLYIFYYFQSFDLLSISNGTTIPQINNYSFDKLKIFVPPLPEQKRIVALLDTVFADLEQARAKTEQNLKNARELFESTCSSSIFSVDVTPSITVFDVAKNEKGSMRTGPFGSQLLKKEIVDSGIAVLGIDNAVNNSFQWGAKRFITPEKFEELSRFEVKPGDVLITIMGTCGRCAIVPENIPKAINTKHICCITLDKSRCLPEYLHAYFLYHPIAKEYLSARAKGAIMAGLNMGIIKELPLVLPDLQEQRQLVSQVNVLKESVDSLKATYESKLVAIDELKKSILQKAFDGELTETTQQATTT